MMSHWIFGAMILFAARLELLQERCTRIPLGHNYRIMAAVIVEQTEIEMLQGARETNPALTTLGPGFKHSERE